MSVYNATYLTGYLLVFVSLLALLLVIPEASAASNRFKPGWRAWVWPLGFLGLLLKNSSEATAGLQRMDNTSLLWQLGDLAACFSLTMLVLNSVYRVLNDTRAHRFTLSAWVAYLLFALALFWFNSFPIVLIYEVLSGVGLTIFYGILYFQQRDRAADAPPVVAGVSLLVLSALLSLFTFQLDLGFLAFNQAVIAHLIQIGSLFFLYKGASNSYSVKYAAQRRLERSQPILNREA
ncbi:MAG: hypothetical protein WCS37_21935 [Chloroflexota bacterium]|nr:hypothetical protein [Chloroflexota bacterium]